MKEKKLPTVSFSASTKTLDLSSQNLDYNIDADDINAEIDLDFASTFDANTNFDETDFSKSIYDSISKNEYHFGWSKKNPKKYAVTPFARKLDNEISSSKTFSLRKSTPKKYAATPFKKLHYDASISSEKNLNSSKDNDKLERHNQSNSQLENDQCMSEMEKAILDSSSPISMNEKEMDTIEVFGELGVLTNKHEIDNWAKQGIPLNEYKLNFDHNPKIIYKKSNRKLNYIQEIAIRYLRPNTPPKPGDIIIREEPNVQLPFPPPLILRQEPPRPTTPPTLVIREAPPLMPKKVGQKIIKISGKILPPPPRRVIIERLPALPPRPPPLLIERWLPYPKQKRKVIFAKEKDSNKVYEKQKNVIIEWEAPKILIKKDIKCLGVVKADPEEYSKKYSKLINPKDMPEFVRTIKPPNKMELASDRLFENYELEGDIQALDLIDLEKEGLGEYIKYTKKFKNSEVNVDQNVDKAINLAIKKILKAINPNNDSQIDHKKANKIFKKVNKRIGKVEGGELFANKLYDALISKGVEIKD